MSTTTPRYASSIAATVSLPRCSTDAQSSSKLFGSSWPDERSGSADVESASNGASPSSYPAVTTLREAFETREQNMGALEALTVRSGCQALVVGSKRPSSRRQRHRERLPVEARLDAAVSDCRAAARLQRSKTGRSRDVTTWPPRQAAPTPSASEAR
jgi:hypothetical protein